MNVSIITLGCRVNQSESNDIEASLKENGITIVNLSEKPDICIINTCSVTSRGDYSSRQVIRRATKTGARIIVTGCYSQLNPAEMKKVSGDCQIVDIRNKKEIIRIVTGESPDTFHVNYSNSRPYLKVQDGCNLSCSYCTVPLARGRSHSLRKEEIIRKARLIEEGGYSEVVLTGIHLGAYGQDLQEKDDIKGLIRVLLQETGIRRIRISSVEINEVDKEFVELLSDTRICRHVHLPMQSGSNRVLTAMNRHYTIEFFRKIVEDIAGRIENIAVGTDIIAGFPGEDEEDFMLTCDTLRELPFAYMHIFPYSPRANTRAFLMKNKVKDSVTKERIRLLKELDGRKRAAYISNQMQRVLDVVVEDRYGDSYSVGTSSNYLKVLFPTVSDVKGAMVSVRAVKEFNGMIEGVVVKKL